MYRGFWQTWRMSGSPNSPEIPGSPRPTQETPEQPPPGVTRVAAREIGGRAGPEPTRYGDWEKSGRCVDF